MAARLSERLETVIRMVTPGHAVLDVGCDHGFTAIRLVEDGISPCAVASDVREGPLAAARQHVAEAGLSEQIAVTLADGVPAGFAGITGTRPVTVILAGMGGLLMTDILKAAFRRGNSFSELVLSPQRDAEALREMTLNPAVYRYLPTFLYEQQDPDIHAVVLRKVGNTLKNSVYQQVEWALRPWDSVRNSPSRSLSWRLSWTGRGRRSCFSVWTTRKS